MPTRLAALAACLVLGASTVVAAADAGPQVPTALAWGADGSLCVALRDGRALVTVDPTRWEVVARRELTFRPNSLALADDRSTWLVSGMDGEILTLRPEGETWLRRANGRGPTRVEALAGGKVAAATRWETDVLILDGAKGAIERRFAVPFPTGTLLARPDGRVIVADAFGGRLADIDPASGRVSVRQIEGVNLRGLAISGDGRELLVGHVAQYNTLPVTSSNIDWGLVISSHLSAVPLAAFDAKEGSTLTRRLSLDGSRHGAADPSAVAVSPDGKTVLLAVAGAHQVLRNVRVGTPADTTADGLLPMGQPGRITTFEVGRSPVALVMDEKGEIAVTADAMSDTLTIFRVAELSLVKTLQLGPAEPVLTAAQRGERHFLDGRRSLDRWMSCDSCHSGGHTIGLNFDTLGDGSYGAPKNTPSLLGVGPTAPYSWIGRFATLEDQIAHSLETSLRGPSAGPEVATDIAAYLRTLPPAPPRRSPDDPAARRGAEVFAKADCATCHKPPTYASAGTKDVDLDDGAGEHEEFNPPSLRGVGWSAPYLHDGRAATLDAVIETHYPGADRPLTREERADLKAFLESL